jgi:hypothetical protein
VWFHFQQGAMHDVHKAATRGKFAIACMHRRRSDVDVGSNVNLNLKLYNSLVLPAMLYMWLLGVGPELAVALLYPG